MSAAPSAAAPVYLHQLVYMSCIPVRAFCFFVLFEPQVVFVDPLQHAVLLTAVFAQPVVGVHQFSHYISLAQPPEVVPLSPDGLLHKL